MKYKASGIRSVVLPSQIDKLSFLSVSFLCGNGAAYSIEASCVTLILNVR